MRIVMVANHFSPCIGGVEKVVMDISKRLIGRGHDVLAVCLNRCAKSYEALPASETVDGIVVDRLAFADLRYYKIAAGVLEKIRDADVVHVHGIGFFSDFLLLTRPLHKKPVVVSTHGGIFHTKNLGAFKSLYFGLLQRPVLGMASKVIAVSRNDFEMFSRICGNAELVENGVNVEKFAPGKKMPNSFLFVGRFSRNKRIELLLSIFAKLRGMGVTLTIAGNDWDGLLKSYLDINVHLGIDSSVRYVTDPTEEELVALYSSHEFFISASEYEGFGISLVEAMASGCIPIVQENKGFGHILGESDCGITLDFTDVNSAAQTISKASGWGAMRKRHLGKMAIGRAQDFSWEKRILKLEKIYSDVK